MSPAEIRAIRKQAGLTQSGLARVLALSGARYVRSLESGERSPSGAVVRLLEMLAAGELPGRYL